MHNNAELKKLFNQTKKYYANTQSITQECSRIPVKGSGLSQDSSRLRVEVPLWLSWLNTSMRKQCQAYIN